MIIDLDAYRVNEEPLKRFIKLRQSYNEPLSTTLNNYAISSNCPLIVLYFYYIEANGPNDNILDTMKRLIKFYRYTSIKGLKITLPDGLL